MTDPMQPQLHNIFQHLLGIVDLRLLCITTLHPKSVRLHIYLILEIKEKQGLSLERLKIFEIATEHVHV